MAAPTLWRPALVVPVALPALLSHRRYQPGFDISALGTTVAVELADLAVLAVVAVAAYAWARGSRFARDGRIVLVAVGALCALVLAATLYGRALSDAYPLGSSLVTALKFCEYALLAPAVALIVRTRGDVRLVLGATIAWAALATFWGALQFVGLVDEFEGRRPLQRETSFLGVHDFAALSGAALAIAFAAIALGPLRRDERRAAIVAGVAGVLGLVLAAALDAVLGIVLAAVLACVLTARARGIGRERVLAIAALTLVVLAGYSVMRFGSIDQYLRFLGVREADEETTGQVQSYAQRTLLLYIGARIFLDHPVVGVGWQGSAQEERFGPYLDDARERFDQPAEAFPSAERPWGVQNAYVQALADMGPLGLVLFLAPFAAGIAVAARRVARGPPELAALALVPALWLAVALGVWNGFGLVVANPLSALTWLAAGLAAACASCAGGDRLASPRA